MATWPCPGNILHPSYCRISSICIPGVLWMMEPQDVLRTSRREEFTQIYRSHKTTNCNRNGTWNRSARLPRPSQLTTDGDLIAPFTVPVLSMKQPERSSPPFPSSN